MEMKLTAQVYGTESFKSKKGDTFRVAKALIEMEPGKADSVRMFLPSDHPEVKQGRHEAVVRVGVRSEMLQLYLVSLTPIAVAVKAA